MINKKISKKAQIESRLVIYVIISVVVIILLISTLVFLKNMKEKQRKIQLEKINQDLKETVDTLDYGSTDEKCMELPEDTTEVCIFDLNKRGESEKSPLIGRYPIIKDSIQSGVPKNLFIISGKKIDSQYIGDVCMDHYPYYSCFEPANKKLCISFEGKGRCALLVNDFKVCRKPNLDADKKITDDPFKIGSTLANLLIPKTTYISTDSQICIEPVNLPAQSLISEIYNITPLGSTIAPSGELSMKFFSELFKSSSDINKVKIKQYNSATKEWTKLTPKSPADLKSKKISSDITKLSTYAVFGPEPPTAVIKLFYGTPPTRSGEKNPTDGIYQIFDTDLITYDASGSFDNDGDSISPSWEFKWRDRNNVEQTRTKSAKTFISSEITPSITFDVLPVYVDVILTVTDSSGETGTKTIKLKVSKKIVSGSGGGNVKNPIYTPIITTPIIDPAIDKAKVIFMIKKTDTNQNDILRLIPVALFTGSIDFGTESFYNYPLLVYTANNPSKDAYYLANLKSLYRPDGADSTVPKIIYYGSQSEVPTELQSQMEFKNIEADYFSLWQQYDDIVVAESGSTQETRLKAALLASELNAPLVFISSTTPTECVKLGASLSEKTIRLVGSTDSFKTNLQSSCSPKEIISYTLLQLNNPSLIYYQELESNFMPASHLVSTTTSSEFKKFRNMPNVLHTWGLWKDNTGLYAAASTETKDVADSLKGWILKSTDNGQSWGTPVVVSNYRAFDIIKFNGKLYAVAEDINNNARPVTYEIPAGSPDAGLTYHNYIIKSTDGLTWSDVGLNHHDFASRLVIFNEMLVTVNFNPTDQKRNIISSIKKDGAIDSHNLGTMAIAKGENNIVDGKDGYLYAITKENKVVRSSDLNSWETIATISGDVISISNWESQNKIVVGTKGSDAKIFTVTKSIGSTPSELITGLSAWYNTQSGYTATSNFGAYVTYPVGSILYFGLSTDVPAGSDGAIFASYNINGGNKINIAKLDEQGVADMHYDGQYLFIAGEDPCCPDGWDNGNIYRYKQ